MDQSNIFKNPINSSTSETSTKPNLNKPTEYNHYEVKNLRITNNLKDENEILKSKIIEEFVIHGKEYIMTANTTDDNYLISKFSLLGTENIEYYRVPFSTIEQILFFDIDSFI